MRNIKSFTSYHFLRPCNLHQLDQRSTNSQKAHAPSHRIDDCVCVCVCINHKSYIHFCVCVCVDRRWKDAEPRSTRKHNPTNIIIIWKATTTLFPIFLWRRWITRRAAGETVAGPRKLVKKRVAAKENPEGKHFGRGAAANWPCQTRQNLISANVVVVDELG